MKASIVFALTVVSGLAIIGIAGNALAPQSNPALQPWLVLRNNLTVKGQMVYEIVCVLLEATCPYQTVENNSNLSLSGVELISYDGSYYYEYRPPPDYPDMLFMVWFTNSTIYCVSPADNWGVSAPLCPQ